MSEYKLSGNVTVAELAQLKSELDALLNGDAEICVTSDALEFIDGSGVQLLVAFIQEAKRHDQTVTWQSIAPALEEAIKLMAVGTLFQLKQSS